MIVLLYCLFLFSFGRGRGVLIWSSWLDESCVCLWVCVCVPADVSSTAGVGSWVGCVWERRECKSTSGVCRQNTRVNNKIHLPTSDCLVTMMHNIRGKTKKSFRVCACVWMREVSISEAMDLNFFSSLCNYSVSVKPVMCVCVCVCFPPPIIGYFRSTRNVGFSCVFKFSREYLTTSKHT